MNRRLSGLSKLNEAAVLQIRRDFPKLPEEYFTFFGKFGWGTLGEDRYCIYSGPVAPTEIYGDGASIGSQNLILGDDCSGYCLAYDTGTGELVEISPSGQIELVGLNFIEFIMSKVAVTGPTSKTERRR